MQQDLTGRTPLQYAIMSRPEDDPAARPPANESYDEQRELKSNAVLYTLINTKKEPLWWIFSGCMLKDVFGFNIIHTLCVSPLSDSLVASILHQAFEFARDLGNSAVAAAAAAADVTGGWTPLHFCCACGRAAVVDALLGNGVSPSPPPTFKCQDLYMNCFSNATTPLHLAVEYSSVALAQQLLSYLKCAHEAEAASAAAALDGNGVSVLQAGIRGGGGSAVLSVLLPLLIPNHNPGGTDHAAGAAAAANSASVLVNSDKFAGTIEMCACVGAVKLIETIMALPGVSKMRNVFGCSVNRAVEQGDMKTLRLLLLLGAGFGCVAPPLGTEQGCGWSVLHFAAAAGNVEILEYLLQRGCDKDIDVQDYFGFTALHVAVHRGKFECVRLLLMKGANHLIQASGRLSVLHVAISRGDTTVLQILSQKSLDYSSPTASATIISLACMSYTTAANGASMLSFLLNGDARAQITSRDHSNGMCALAVAARSGDPSLFSRLIDAGASCHTLSYDGRDIVSHAASSASGNCSVIMSILQAMGVSFIRPSCFGKRPLHYMAEYAPTADISMFLKQEGVKKYINEPDFSGYTPFLCAAKRGRVDACALLLLQGAVATSTTDLNENCLHIACANGHADLVTWLLSVVPSDYIYAKAPDTLPDCVAAAVHAQSSSILTSLLQRQVRPPPGWDLIPLKLAAACSNVMIMRALLDAGASAERSGELLLAACVKLGHLSVAEELLKRASSFFLQGNWSPSFSPLCHAIVHAQPPPARPEMAHAILDAMCGGWSGVDVQRILQFADTGTGFAALPLAIIYGHLDIADRILDLDDHTSNAASHPSPLVARVYANGLNATCLAAGSGHAGLLKRMLWGGGCDLSVVCAAAGRGQHLDENFPSIASASSNKHISDTIDDVLALALSAASQSRIDLNDVWNGRQPLWFACRTGNHRAAQAIMSASGTVKPALTTEVKFKLGLHRHHTPLQAAAASGDEKMVSWLLTYAAHVTSNAITSTHAAAVSGIRT